MLRQTEDQTTRRLPDRNGTIRGAAYAALAAIVLLASPAAAHGGAHQPAGDAGPLPYLGGMGDPNGLAITHHAEAKPLLVADTSGHMGADNPLAEKVREVNARFADVGVATAEGYAPIPCVSGIEGGAMGIHYVNGALIEDGVVDISKPEAVMYEPQADGTMKLVAVEYITTKGPANLDGHLFSFTNSPNRYGLPPFYELHVWAWRGNPTGTFADMNPNVSCDAAVAAAN